MVYDADLNEEFFTPFKQILWNHITEDFTIIYITKNFYNPDTNLIYILEF